MAHTEHPPLGRDRSRHCAPRSSGRHRRLSATRVLTSSAALVTAAMVAASCAPPNNAQGSGDGGVAVSSASTPTAPAGAPVDVVLADTKGLDGPMTIAPFVTTTSAGDVTFVVKNVGTIEHEMLVLKTDTPFDKIPITDSGDPPESVATGADKIDEADSVGETGDPNLQPGDTRTFTITGLTPGNYVLVCNIARHYGLGMRAAFRVT